MALEPVFNYIEDLNEANPNGDPDQVLQGDDHIRGVKKSVKGSFPNLGQEAVTKTAAEINDLASTTELTEGLDTKVGPEDYAAPTVGGTLKARLQGTILYLTNDGTDP